MNLFKLFHDEHSTKKSPFRILYRTLSRTIDDGAAQKLCKSITCVKCLSITDGILLFSGLRHTFTLHLIKHFQEKWGFLCTTWLHNVCLIISRWYWPGANSSNICMLSVYGVCVTVMQYWNYFFFSSTTQPKKFSREKWVRETFLKLNRQRCC